MQKKASLVLSLRSVKGQFWLILASTVLTERSVSTQPEVSEFNFLSGREGVFASRI